jgi:TolA-binding protein
MVLKKAIPLLAIVLASCAPTVPQEIYDQAQSTIQAQDTQSAHLQVNAADLRATEAQLQASLSQSEDRVSELETQVERLTTERNQARNQATQLQATISTYECDEALTAMDYTSVADASTMLMAFVAQQPWAERVQGTFRDSIWTNAGSKIHGVRYVDSSDHLPYVTYFMVYFDEFGWERGVFWVDRQCWLER